MIEYYNKICKCGCGQKLPIKRFHKYYGTPNYITGHNKSMLGKKFSEEHKKNISLAKIGRKHSEESKRKIGLANLGRKHSNETKMKISKSLSGKNNHFYGKNFSEEHKRKLSESKFGCKNHFYGKNHSNETKNKISLINKGKRRSEETKIKMSETRLGNKNHFYGKHHTEKIKRKMSIQKTGEKNSRWCGGISFEPYSKDFNSSFKNSIRGWTWWILLQNRWADKENYWFIAMTIIIITPAIAIPVNGSMHPFLQFFKILNVFMIILISPLVL